MIVYLDTNVYIGAKYQFSSDKFRTLRSLISDGDVQVIYSSATRGEVEQHLREDIKAGVSQYNRLLRKDLLPLVAISDCGLCSINEEKALSAMEAELSSFLSLDGVSRIDLNPLDAEQLMNDYFLAKFPFESKKPYEFKDAIMINAVKHYHEETLDTIVVVSNDDGFRKAFEGATGFVTVKYLSDLFRICQDKKEENAKIEASIADAIDNDIFNDQILSYFADFDIDRGYYGEWECDEHQIESAETELTYVEFVDGKCLAHINVVLYICAEITHRDEDTSYFDKEEHQYLVENFVTWREKHRIETEIIIECSVDKEDADSYVISEGIVIDDSKFKTLDLDEGTLQDWDEIDTECHEEPDLIYCSECGKILGHEAEYTDYDDNPLYADCMVSNSKGDICPACGRKVPSQFMNAGFCIDCFRDQD